MYNFSGYGLKILGIILCIFLLSNVILVIKFCREFCYVCMVIGVFMFWIVEVKGWWILLYWYIC